MSYISSQTGKLHQKKETKRLKNFPARNMWEYFIEIWQIVLTAQLPLSFIAELLTMLMCNLKTSKYRNGNRHKSLCNEGQA